MICLIFFVDGVILILFAQEIEVVSNLIHICRNIVDPTFALLC